MSNSLAALDISGADAASFLQNLSPILLNPNSSITPYCLLDKKGIILYGAWLYSVSPNHFLLITDSALQAEFLTFLDSKIFAEEVSITLSAVSINTTAEQSQLILDQLFIESSCLALAWNYLGLLFNESRLFSYKQQDKCYPGQEIVARIRDRGQVSRTSICINRTDLFSLMTLDPQAQVMEESTEAQIWVHTKTSLVPQFQQVFCPVIPTATQNQINSLYETALGLFHLNKYDEALNTIESALGLNPYNSTYWELKAILLEKLAKPEEAIYAQKKFAELEPLAVMPLANLSRLYMLKGQISKAEEVQERAQILMQKLESNPDLDTQSWQEIQAQMDKLKAEKIRKMNLFKSALEIDPEDDIALFGLGKLLADSQNFNEALPYLKKLVNLQPDYSAAWAQYARSAIKCLSSNEALAIVEQGIHCAQTHKDLMPLKLMQSLKRQLNIDLNLP